MPELMPVQAQSNRVRGTGKDCELAVRHWKLANELEQVIFGGNAIVFAARDEHRHQEL